MQRNRLRRAQEKERESENVVYIFHIECQYHSSSERVGIGSIGAADITSIIAIVTCYCIYINHRKLFLKKITKV